VGDRESVRVLLIDDQDLVRSGLRMILESQPDLEVSEAGDAPSGLAAAAELRPDVVLMDVRMPGMDGIDGIEATRRMTAMDHPPAVVVLTTFDLDHHVYDAIRAGATGFLTKNVTRADLVVAVRAAARGDALLAPSTTRRLLAHFVAQPPRPGAAVGTGCPH
jgi:DNA-binding NarL/FixJ family response regulator